MKPSLSPSKITTIEDEEAAPPAGLEFDRGTDAVLKPTWSVFVEARSDGRCPLAALDGEEALRRVARRAPVPRGECALEKRPSPRLQRRPPNCWG